MLKFLVGTQAEHFLTATGSVALLESLVNNIKELLEFEGGPFFRENSHEFFVAGCRFQMVYLGRSAAERDPTRVTRGEAALDVMDGILATRDWFAAGRLTVADIALLAYTRLAGEGGFDLSTRPRVVAWIARCERALGLAAVATAQ